jgi:hypothetical protein
MRTTYHIVFSYDVEEIGDTKAHPNPQDALKDFQRKLYEHCKSHDDFPDIFGEHDEEGELVRVNSEGGIEATLKKNFLEACGQTFETTKKFVETHIGGILPERMKLRYLKFELAPTEQHNRKRQVDDAQVDHAPLCIIFLDGEELNLKHTNAHKTFKGAATEFHDTILAWCRTHEKFGEFFDDDEDFKDQFHGDFAKMDDDVNFMGRLKQILGYLQDNQFFYRQAKVKYLEFELAPTKQQSGKRQRSH